jgi:cytochrome c oxidase subunit II
MKIAAATRTPKWPAVASRGVGIVILLVGALLAAGLCIAGPRENPVPSIFEPHSTPADSIRHLSHFVLGITGLIFVVVCGLLIYALVKFRGRTLDREREPAHV